MKRALFTALASIAFLAVCAQTGNSDPYITGGQVVGLGLKDYVNIVDKVEGHVFLSKGERRELAKIVENAKDELPNVAPTDELTWEAYNSGIVEIDTENGTITGKKFGQTIVEVKDPEGDNFYVAILVCPTITIKSPEGAIYKHQKMYGSKARIQLTQSKDWLVNCVMLADVDDEGNIQEPYDVTSYVDADGTFVTPTNVKNDMILTVSMEENNDDFSDNDNVDANLGVSGLSLRVNSVKGIVEFHNENEGYNLDELRKYKLSISPIMYPEKELFGKTLPEKNIVSFGAGNQGVFVLCFKDGNDAVVGGKFKVIIQREFAISPETPDVADNTVE